MPTRDINQLFCVLIFIVDGCEEAETILLLSALRRAGVCIKSISLTSGLISGAHGIWLMPDLALADIDRLINTTPVKLIIVPEGGQNLAILKADPRVHKLLRQVVAQKGQIAVGPEGLQVLQAAGLWVDKPGEIDDNDTPMVLLRDPQKSLESFAQDLIRRLKLPPRA